MSRPEHIAPAEVFYDHVESAKYTDKCERGIAFLDLILMFLCFVSH